MLCFTCTSIRRSVRPPRRLRLPGSQSAMTFGRVGAGDMLNSPQQIRE